MSLGATRRFAVKARGLSREVPRWSADLAAGDLVVMRGRAQVDYQHAVLKTARPVGARINLTFRLTGA